MYLLKSCSWYFLLIKNYKKASIKISQALRFKNKIKEIKNVPTQPIIWARYRTFLRRVISIRSWADKQMHSWWSEQFNIVYKQGFILQSARVYWWGFFGFECSYWDEPPELYWLFQHVLTTYEMLKILISLPELVLFTKLLVPYSGKE